MENERILKEDNLSSLKNTNQTIDKFIEKQKIEKNCINNKDKIERSSVKEKLAKEKKIEDETKKPK